MLIIEIMMYFINIKKNKIILFKYINNLECYVFDVVKFNVNMVFVGELDIVYVYGLVFVIVRVCRVWFLVFLVVILEVVGRLVMLGGVFVCILMVNILVEVVLLEYCNVRV